MTQPHAALFAIFLASATGLSACSGEIEGTDPTASQLANQAANGMTVFVTSQNSSGNLGGIAGADTLCQSLAEAAGAGDGTWRAYLSAEDDGSGSSVNARDRIGPGPYVNANGDALAEDIDQLHSMLGEVDAFVDENGARVNGQWADSPDPNEHDIMTGSNADGTLLAGATCNSWTSESDDDGGPQVGHSDGLGPNMNPDFNSWNSQHQAPGCSVDGLSRSGSAGKIYCFAE